MSFEENEISKNAFGGTELAKRKLTELLDPKLLDEFQIVSSRVRELDESKIRVFFAHDLPEDPESQKFQDVNFINKFHKFVFISNWQYQRYQLIRSIPYDEKSVVIESGIEPAPSNVFEMKKSTPIRIVYTSTPQRGLQILVPVFKKLCELYDDIHLEVFSSFKIYGWDDADKQFEPLYDEIRNHPNMTYHGFVPNTELKETLNECHIFAYPCIWLETSCRAMLEAMSAGLVCVHPNYGALAETSGALNIMYQGDMSSLDRHANIFAGSLNAAIQTIKSNQEQNMIRFGKVYVDSRYGIDRIKAQWELMLNSLLKQYPTVESRKFPEAKFVYKS
jgi:UDP-glucose:(glucosyl)LPS alpha-1,2-glucosyltransferase